MQSIKDSCGNCHQGWPCNCNDPVRICGICAGDTYDCRCDERSLESIECPNCFGAVRCEPYWPEYLNLDDVPTAMICSCTCNYISYSRPLTDDEEAEYISHYEGSQ